MHAVTRDILHTLKIVILALALSIGISYLYAAWSPPTATPPSGNTPAPINVGSGAQTKEGSLGVIGFFGGTEGYFTTNLGIGDATPDVGTDPAPDGQPLKLDVEGAVGAEYYCNESGNRCVAADDLADLGEDSGGLPECDDGQILVYDSGSSSWECGDLPVGGEPAEPVTLVNGVHTSDDCEAAGGNKKVAEPDTHVCEFTNSSFCPDGWMKYKDWSTGETNTCSALVKGDCIRWESPYGVTHCVEYDWTLATCTAIGWGWSDSEPSFCRVGRTSCYGVISTVGCY